MGATPPKPPALPPTQRKQQAPRWGCFAAIGIAVIVVIAAAVGGHGSSDSSNTSQPTANFSTVQPTDTPVPVASTTSPTAVVQTNTPAPVVATPPPPVATAAPTAAPVGGSVCYIDPEGSCYRAGEFCPNAMHGATIQGATGPLKCEYNNGWRWESV